MAPIILPSNQLPDRFYKGGAQISAFRSEPIIDQPEEERKPEDWIASTTCCHGQNSLGLTRLPSGVLLIDEIKENPEKWLGQGHIKAYGVDTKLLVKLLDAGQRLPVHAHPSAKWAKEHIGHSHGKAEAWYILTPGEVHLGLRESVSIPDLLKLVRAQDVDALLGMMHKVPLKANQTIYIPPGLLHAIGEGILLVEVQEPEDLSVLLEWRGFQIDGEKDGHLGLGFETALTAVDTSGRTYEEIQKLVSSESTYGSIIAPASREYFEFERIKVAGEEQYRSGFAIIVALDGQMELTTSTGDEVNLEKGVTAVLPYADGAITLRGSGEVLISRPPVPR